MMQREKGALMRDMFHLPHGDASLLTGEPMQVEHATLIGSFRHTITNRRITFDVYQATGNGQRATWIHPRDLPTIPHPSYVRKALQLAGICK